MRRRMALVIDFVGLLPGSSSGNLELKLFGVAEVDVQRML